MSKTTRIKSCRNCGSTELTRDLTSSSGDLSCSACGSVQEENPIVSEVQFGEASNGAAMVQGAMVGSDQTRAYNSRTTLESREQTIMNAKQKIRTIAGVMRIPDYIVESACGWFKLALVQNFVQGRRSQNVIAACLYVACRHEKTHHLLIDFSSRLQISVYSLGATYLKLVRALQIQRLPLADPSLFVQHFAERLNFGEYTAKVCRDATKIASRMSSDWIYEGRRPAGIAGACLLLAARMNNFRRSHAEIVAVARVGEETLQKRLNEFKSTQSAKLSVAEFRESSGVDDTSKPPSYNKNRRIEKKIERLMKQRRETLETYKRLAKERSLFKKLDILSSDGSIKSQLMADEDSELENEATTNVSADKLEQKKTATSSKRAKSSSSTYSSDNDADYGSENENGPAWPEERPLGARTSEAELSTDTQASRNSEQSHSVEGVDGTQAAHSRPAAVTEESREDDSGDEAEGAIEKSEVNPLFVPSDKEDEDFGYEDLPDSEDDADSDFENLHDMITSRFRNLRSDSKQQKRDRQLRAGRRLAGLQQRASSGSSTTLKRRQSTRSLAEPEQRQTKGRLEGMGSPRNRLESRSSTKPRSEQSVAKANAKAAEKAKAKSEGQQSRQNELMKAVLLGGELTEEDLEIALDRLLQGHSKSLDEHLYKTPADMDAVSDITKRIELDRPKNLVKNNPTTEEILSRVPGDEEINSDEDDEEVENIMLDEEERMQKEQIWIALNHDFLIAQEKKRLKIEADELTGNTSGQTKKRRKAREPKDAVLNDSAVASAIQSIGEGGKILTPAESTKQMLQKKPFSKKINYDSIGELFTE